MVRKAEYPNAAFAGQTIEDYAGFSNLGPLANLAPFRIPLDFDVTSGPMMKKCSDIRPRRLPRFPA